MKNLIIFIILLFSASLSAQQFDIVETDYPHEDKVYEAIKISIDAEKDEAKEAWNDFIQDEYDIDVKGYGFFVKKDELKTEPIPTSFLSPETRIMHTHFAEKDGYTQLYIYATKSDDTPVIGTSDTLALSNLESISEEYISYFLPAYYEEKAIEMTEYFEEVTEDIEDMESEVSESQEEIRELQAKVKELHVKITESKNEKEKAKRQLNRSLEILEQVKESIDKM